ncbi:MAG: lipid-A-disaccharide synthase [Pseudomonadota bacterium]
MADIFIVAAEPSGDQLGAALAGSLKKTRPDIRLSGIGGSRMAEAGLPSAMPTDGLAVLGFVEGLMAYPLVLSKVRQATDIILSRRPDCVVLIDSWGFMVRIAKRLKSKGYPGEIVKYVAPQVWATRPGRARILAQHVDHLLSTQPMDEPHFKAAGLPTTFVGNPVLDTDYRSGNAKAFAKTHSLGRDKPVLGLLPGSRRAEIERVGPALVKALGILEARFPDLQTVCVASDAVKDAVEKLFADRQVRMAEQSALIDALSVMDVALACSGTVTTQLAAAGVPSVVLYKLSPLTYAVASRIFRSDYVSLVNISADTHGDVAAIPLMPEFLQDDIMTDGPVEILANWLEHPDAAARLSDQLKRETRRMGAGSGSASDKAAAAILRLIGEA